MLTSRLPRFVLFFSYALLLFEVHAISYHFHLSCRLLLILSVPRWAQDLCWRCYLMLKEVFLFFPFHSRKKKLISSMIIWSYFCIACKSTIFCHCLIVSSSIQWFPILWKFEGHGFVNFVCCALSLFLNTISGFNRDRCHQWWKCHSPGIGYCTSSSKSMFSFNVLFLCFSLFFLLYSSLYATKLALLPVSSLLFYFVDALPIWHDMTFCC